MKLKSAKVLVVGAGGLGCPALQYLAAAGVGHIGIIDYDRVEASNLHRQILYSYEDIGKIKSDCAASRMRSANPFIQVVSFNERLTVRNIRSIVNDYDLIIDGSDNFPTRYLVNDACVLSGKTFVHGSVNKFNGQVAVFNHLFQSGVRSATYRCVFPSPPVTGSVLSCNEEGILGIIPGMVGVIQATEAIKIITGIGEPLADRLLILDATDMKFTSISVTRNEAGWKEFPATEAEFSLMNYDYICNRGSHVKSISVAELEKYLDENKDSLILDVREFHEKDVYVTARRMPLSEIPEYIEYLKQFQSIVLVCNSGIRSAQAINILHNLLPDLSLIQLDGGWNEWSKHHKTVSHE
jgi:sulfur-carrier protein adenylyltransferase/sulfurtransferase